MHENPILHNICKSFGSFKKEFTDKDDNFKKALIFRNPFSGEAGTTTECCAKGFLEITMASLKKSQN
jgi:hypothetical protein